MVHKFFAIWICKDPTSHYLSKLKLPLNQLLCQHSKESLVHTIKLCITTNTKDSRLFTKETILVYISPFSILNTWPLHWQVLGFSGNPWYLPISAQSAIHRQCSLIVHAVQTNPLTHPQICLDSSVSLSPRDSFYRVEQRYVFPLFHGYSSVVWLFIIPLHFIH